MDGWINTVHKKNTPNTLCVGRKNVIFIHRFTQSYTDRVVASSFIFTKHNMQTSRDNCTELEQACHRTNNIALFEMYQWYLSHAVSMRVQYVRCHSVHFMVLLLKPELSWWKKELHKIPKGAGWLGGVGWGEAEGRHVLRRCQPSERTTRGKWITSFCHFDTF